MKRILVLSAFVLVIGLFGIVESCNNEPDTPSDGGERVTVDIYSFADFHGVLEDTEDPINPGAARFIAVTKEIMSQSEPGHSLLLSAGDNYHNWQYDNNMSNVFRGKPVSEMFKKFGVKYSVIGNHDWDWGEKFDEYSSEAGGMTYLAANLFLKGTDTRPDFCKPYAIETIAGKKIGIVGLTLVNMAPHVHNFDDENLIDPYDFRDVRPGPWLKNLIADLKKECDAVIALTHLDDLTVFQMVGKYDVGFDAIILGHTHATANRVSGKVPIVQAAHYGRGLAKLSFVFNDNGLVEIKHEIFGPGSEDPNNILNDTYLPAGEVDEEMAALVAKYNAKRPNP